MLEKKRGVADQWTANDCNFLERTEKAEGNTTTCWIKHSVDATTDKEKTRNTSAVAVADDLVSTTRQNHTPRRRKAKQSKQPSILP